MDFFLLFISNSFFFFLTGDMHALYNKVKDKSKIQSEHLRELLQDKS